MVASLLEKTRSLAMVQIMKKRIDWVGALAAFFGAAVVIPSLAALAIAIGTVVMELF